MSGGSIDPFDMVLLQFLRVTNTDHSVGRRELLGQSQAALQGIRGIERRLPMSRYTIAQGYPPTPEEVAQWQREANYLRYQAPNPHAPEGTSAALGWGIPEDWLPHGDCVEHVMAIFKRDVAGVPMREKLRPEYKWSILSVCMAHFLWFRTEPGYRWVLKFFGVEEVTPFFNAYAYMYALRETGTEQNHYVKIDHNGPIKLRIYRRCERTLDSPVSEPYDEASEQMQMLLSQARDPNAVEPMAESSPDMYHWVSEQIRDWFLELSPSKEWPSRKPNRIGGYQWVKNLKRPSGDLVFEPLNQVELHKGRAYKLKPDNGNVIWCGGKSIRAVPLKDYYTQQENCRFTEHQLDNMFRCSSCNKMRSCTPATGEHKMCVHCFGTIVEKDDRPALNLCTMHECRRCTDHLSNHSELVNLKNRLNRDVHFPVRR